MFIEEGRGLKMSATAEDVLTLTLRNIEVGPVVQQRRAAP